MSCRILNTYPENIEIAVDYLKMGQLVAFPTETVYGLGGNAYDDKAIARIYATKQRPDFNPLIAHYSNITMAEQDVIFTDNARILAKHFWPGPLTMILPRTQDSRLSLLASAGLDTVGIRIPNSPIAQDLIRQTGFPLAAPSANLSGTVSPTAARHVADSLATADIVILDGGNCTIGLESTVVDMTGNTPTILRPGSITKEDIESVLNSACTYGAHDAAIKAPGMLKSHYAPSLPIRLNALTADTDEILLTFGDTPAHTAHFIALSPSENLQEAASNLFRALRDADNAIKYKGIAVMPIQENGIGLAINDRLKRAAA